MTTSVVLVLVLRAANRRRLGLGSLMVAEVATDKEVQFPLPTTTPPQLGHHGGDYTPLVTLTIADLIPATNNGLTVTGSADSASELTAHPLPRAS